MYVNTNKVIPVKSHFSRSTVNICSALVHPINSSGYSHRERSQRISTFELDGGIFIIFSIEGDVFRCSAVDIILCWRFTLVESSMLEHFIFLHYSV